MTAEQNLEVYRILMGISGKNVVPEMLDFVGRATWAKRQLRIFPSA
jgi:hypothetical protein